MASEKHMKMIRFLLPVEDADELEVEAKKLNISVSAFMRLLIKQWSESVKFERGGSSFHK